MPVVSCFVLQKILTHVKQVVSPKVQPEREMLLYRIDILSISECRWTGNGSVTTSLGNTIIYSGRKDNDHKQGVAIMMSKAAKKSMIE